MSVKIDKCWQTRVGVLWELAYWLWTTILITIGLAGLRHSHSFSATLKGVCKDGTDRSVVHHHMNILELRNHFAIIQKWRLSLFVLISSGV